MKHATDFHKFRSRDHSRDVQQKAFSTSTYLSQAATIERAVKEASRFETDKFYTKKKFVFREH